MTRKRFKDDLRQDQYERVIKMYHEKNKMLWAEGRPNRGNSWGAAFWAGYDGYNTGLWSYQSAADRQSGGYIFYKAGQDVQKDTK